MALPHEPRHLHDARRRGGSGIRLIFELAHRLGDRGQKLELVVPDNSVINRLLVLTDLHQVVPMSNSVDAVLRDS